MSNKRILLIHGRAIKPAQRPMEQLAKDAILEGLRRHKSHDVAKRIEQGTLAFEIIYFGDITNKIQAAARKSDGALLTAKDKDHGNAACFPIQELQSAFDEVVKIKSFSKAQYDQVLKTADDWRYLDEAADFFSMLGTVLTNGHLNDVLIANATPDLAAYFTEHSIASQIRKRLNEVLAPALTAGDDVCLIAHSMGAMVSYDTMWKYSHTSEYTNSPMHGKPITRFITLGCPLGETGVRKNLLDGKFHNPLDQYPRNQIKEWWNVYAQDDYIARSKSMRTAFADMRLKKHVENIQDRHIYNCWSYVNKSNNHKVSNPHDLYGYLMNPTVGKIIADWAA